MSKSEMAAGFFKGGYNCSTSVLASFCEDYDLDTELAMKLACGLGGGCVEGEICGAASAAAIVVGLKYGQYIQGDTGTKTNCYAKTKQVTEAFKNKNGALACRDLLGDLRGKDDEESMKERRRLCTGFVESAAEILEELEY